MRLCLLPLFALGLASVSPVLAAPPSSVLQLSTFPQRMADRYTTHDGLPGNRATRIKVSGVTVTVETEAGQAIFAEGKWKTLDANHAVSFALPPVDAAKLPAGARVLDAAQTPDKRLWIVTDRGVFRSEGDKYAAVPKPLSYLTRQPVVNIDADMNSVRVDKNGHVWFGSQFGLVETDGANWWNPIDRRSGMPYENVTCFEFGANSDLWVGTTEGVCRYTGGNWQYYWGKRWLPNNHVNAIAVAPDGSAWVATDGGVARLYDKQITLEEKAKHFETITARHNRYGLVTGSQLKKPGDVTGGVIYDASDNDGLWTSFYVGAEAYRYAVTKEPEARALAKKSMWAMLDLMKYSGVPGFPARTMLRKDEKDVGGFNGEETVRVAGETDKIWFTSPIDPNVWCKGDTSSDELTGHYFAFYTYYTLVADAAEKKVIRDAVCAITDNILNHDLNLVGPTGRPTLWGFWNPKQLNDDPIHWEERGLNSLEILAFLKLAEHVSGDPKYTAKYRELIEKHHYLLNTVNQKVAEPWYIVNHSDDEMAFQMYYILLILEKDPETRRTLLLSLDRSWKIERPESCPFTNFIYGAVTGRACDVENSVTTLQDWPWELIDWQTRNSQRTDLTLLIANYQGRNYVQSATPIPYAEQRVMRWNANPYDLDAGTLDGQNEEDAAAWLAPYWMGRYYGFISGSKAMP